MNTPLQGGTPNSNDSYFVPIPSVVGMAMQFVGWAENIRQGPPNRFNGEPTSGRQLSQPEVEVYDSALKVLLDYFTGQALPSSSQFISSTPYIIPPYDDGSSQKVTKNG